jgi:uncharacterized membrane protein
MNPRSKSHPWIIRLVMARPRLWISVALGIVCYLTATALAHQLNAVTRALMAWDIGVLFYLAAVAHVMAQSTPAEIRRHAAAQDEGAFALLILTVASALASLGAIFVELAGIERDGEGYGLYAAHGVVTVILSWAFIHTIFALHYAHEFYSTGDRARGLNFPGGAAPDYWDFIYFSFVIGMTFQVSDIAVTNKWIRRTVVIHGALSFLFTTAILALTINIAATAFSR